MLFQPSMKQNDGPIKLNISSTQMSTPRILRTVIKSFKATTLSNCLGKTIFSVIRIDLKQNHLMLYLPLLFVTCACSRDRLVCSLITQWSEWLKISWWIYFSYIKTYTHGDKRETSFGRLFLVPLYFFS